MTDRISVGWGSGYPLTPHDGDPYTVSVLSGTRLQRIIRHHDGWQVWIATRDYRHGTYLMLYNDGRIVRVTAREDEGDEIMPIRPNDTTAEGG